MRSFLRDFSRHEDGAVTVDWVVLTGIIIGMTLGIIMMLRTAATDPAEGLGAHLAAREIQ